MENGALELLAEYFALERQASGNSPGKMHSNNVPKDTK
jgi:hypothetical protein